MLRKVVNIEEHITYLSKDEPDVFVISAVNEIIAQIKIVNEKALQL